MLPSVEVDSYNLEVEDDEGFIGDKASKSAFRAILDNVRAVLREDGDDPVGDEASEEISKKKLDNMLVKGDAGAAAVVQTAVEMFAQQLHNVIKRYLRQKSWLQSLSAHLQVRSRGRWDSQASRVPCGRKHRRS